MVDNIFDLSALAEPPNDVEVQPKQHDKAALLVGYDEVPRELWQSIAVNAQIRYLRKDGKFVPGGYVRGVFIEGDHVSIHMAYGSGAGLREWRVSTAKILKIWQKKAAAPQRDVVAEKLKYLEDSVQLLTAKVQKHESEIVRLVRLIMRGRAAP